MADELTPIPGTGPPKISVAQAFGFMMDEKVIVPAMQATIDAAQQAADSYIGMINKSMIDDVASAAGQTDAFKAKIAASVAQPVIEAQAALEQLQQPIYSHLVNQLGATIEATIPLGVTPTGNEGGYVCPACVQIRAAGQENNLAPAMECFRAAALPLYGVDGVKYSETLDWIQRCLPADENLQNVFMAWVGNVTQESALNAPPQFPSTPAVPGTSHPPDSVVAVMAGLESGTMNQSGMGAPPSLPASPVTRTSLPVTKPVIPPGGQFVPPGQPAPSPAPGGAASGGSGGGLTGGLPTFPGCAALQALSPGQAQAQFPAGNYSITGGWTVQIGYGVDPITGAEFVTGSCINCPPGIGPSPFQCILATETAPQPPPIVPPTPGQISPPPTAPQPASVPACPAPPTCQPVQVTVKPCETPKPPDQQQPRTYCVWQNVETNQCYVDTQDNGPRSPNDRQLFCGKIDAGFVSQAIAACCQSQPQQSIPTYTASDLQALAGPFQGGCPDFPPAPVAQAGNGFATILQWLGIFDASGQPVIPFPTAGVTDVGQRIANAFVQLFGSQLVNLAKGIDSFLAGSGCADGTQLNLVATSAVLGFVERWAGADLTQMVLPLQYQRQFRCPTGLPAPNQAASAWLANEIDLATRDCWLQANNVRPAEANTWIHGARTKLSPMEYATLYMRDFLNQADFNLRIRSAGMLQATDPDDLLNLLKQIPPPTDLTRFMVRDVADEALVAQFQLDADFDIKFAGKLQDWARQQGVDPLYMKYFWRAHWSIPAPGQLAEMLHRNSRLPPGDPAFVDVATVRRALEQQDIAPFWIDKFLQISYRPLTRIDARRAYEIGSLDADGLKEAYLNLGYNDQSASTLVDFNRKNVTRTFMRRGEIKQLAAGQMGDADYVTSMQLFGADDDIINQGRDYADLLRRVDSNKRCLAAYRKRFIQGEINATDAGLMVQSLGQTQQAAEVIVGGWQCEVVSRGKNFSFAQLNDLYTQGLIDENDYVQRAVRLGWNNDDTVLMLRLIQRRLNIKATNAQIAESQREQRAAQRLARQLRQAERQAQSDATKAVNSAAKLQRLKQLREKRLLEAGQKFSKNSGMPLPDAFVYVKGLFEAATKQYAVTYDEAIASLLVITSDIAVTTTSVLEQALATALTETASLGQQLAQPDAANPSTPLAPLSTIIR